MKSLFTALAIPTFAFTVAISPIEAAQFRVSQESTAGSADFNNNIVGFIEAFTTTKTLAQFYQYSTPFRTSFNGPVSLTSNASHLFLVKATDGLGLFSVHDKPQDGSGGEAQMQFDLLGDTASLIVNDDPEEPVKGNGTTFIAYHSWASCCTDGAVLGSLEGDWKMFVQLTRFRAMDRWLALSGTGSSLALTLATERRVRIEATWNDPHPVPEPTSELALLLVGAIGSLSARKRGKRQSVQYS
jgi:PEP-CTERM motif